MRNDDDISTLIEELKSLRVRETALLHQIEEANRQRQEDQQDNDGKRGSRSAQQDTGMTYHVQDRVYVVNQIRRPVFAPTTWTGYNKRRAMVMRVTGEKIFIKTNNGTETWQAAKNLRLLHP
jgi:hypothetical protein